MLTLLDLSAAFDTVDHPILLRRLTTSYGFNGVVHMWSSSYLANRTQYVRCPGSRSTPLLVLCGVPQRSVLGLLLFLLYTADLVPPFDNYEEYVDQCPVTCCSRLSWRWCSPDLTTAQRLLLVCRSSSWTGFSPCRT